VLKRCDGKVSEEEGPPKSDLARLIESLFPETEEVERVDPVSVASSPETEAQNEPPPQPDLDSPVPSVAKGDPAEAVIKALRDVTALYAVAAGEEKTSLVDPLLAASETARRIGAFDTLAEAVNALMLRDDPVAGELLDDDVRASMARLLGSIRDESERKALIKAYGQLDDSIAQAIADALADTDDRQARKAYIGALCDFGPAGIRVVEAMLQDPIWFVVRNGVSVLGEIGGEESVELLTGTLANEDVRVRRETVVSLSKIGGENAAILVSGMLNDADSGMRVSAARAVGVLKVERAYRTLIKILEDGDDDAVIEQVLRALGQLGDASAVQAIEKRAVTSMFKRSPTGIRVAALTALAAIGTPRALEIVEKAAKDKDAEVRSAVEQIAAV
jgi:HEAT repeat protein